MNWLKKLFSAKKEKDSLHIEEIIKIDRELKELDEEIKRTKAEIAELDKIINSD